MKKILFYLLFCSSCITLIHAQDSTQINFNTPREYSIANISFEDADNVNHQVLKLVTGLTDGDKITIPGEKISEAIQNLWRQGLF
ncbi:MAG TPA: hypothetical protein VGO45_11015, partial [Bacteroidia bacterium]|nr:hypothetical protein [Bacteroidia bacterium]